MWDFYVGQMVVCVDDDFRAPSYIRIPVKGCIYSIREIEQVGSELGLALNEVRNPLLRPPYIRMEPVWRLNKFRPVKPTSIECFRQLLAPRKHEVLA